MVKFVNILAGVGAASINPDGSSSVSTTTLSTVTSSGEEEQKKKTLLMLTTCPFTREAVDDQWERFHSHRVCNKREYNRFVSKLGFYKTYKSLQIHGRHTRVPNQKTITCPNVVYDLTVPHQVTGFHTPWVVENTASVPIVLSIVTTDGVESSAADWDISPPEHDPNAILGPGESTVAHTYYGDVFYARELLPDGSAGKVLLQHRVGLIPIGGGGDRKNALVCPDDGDEEPTIIREDGTEDVDPNFERVEPRNWKECNTLLAGFRNMAGCPLHGYYVEPDTCLEEFRFHLGVETTRVDDFMWDWKSYSKFEESFIGDTFVFRSAFSDQVVDTVTFQPTQIVDCPDLQQTVATTTLTTQNILLVPSSEQLRNSGNSSNNMTNTSSTVLHDGSSRSSLFFTQNLASDHLASAGSF